MAYKYGYRHVAFLRTQKEVEAELNEIYKLNDGGKDIMSLQVIPRYFGKYFGNEAIPSRYEISYVYRYESGKE